jgi:hypothetical protein
MNCTVRLKNCTVRLMNCTVRLKNIPASNGSSLLFDQYLNRFGVMVSLSGGNRVVCSSTPTDQTFFFFFRLSHEPSSNHPHKTAHLRGCAKELSFLIVVSVLRARVEVREQATHFVVDAQTVERTHTTSSPFYTSQYETRAMRARADFENNYPLRSIPIRCRACSCARARNSNRIGLAID